MQCDAPFGELNWKRRRMRTFFLPTLNCLVRNKPRVPAATQIFSPSMRPPRDVALVLIRHAKCQPIQFDAAGLREVENVFVAIVQKPPRIDRLEMTKRANGCSRFPAGSARVARRAAATMIVDRDGFNPVNRVLQHEQIAQRHDDLVRQHRIRRRGTDVEKKRTIRPQHAPDSSRPFATPTQIRPSVLMVGILPVANSEIVWRRRHDKINASLRQSRHSCDAILPAKIEFSHWLEHSQPNHCEYNKNPHCSRASVRRVTMGSFSACSDFRSTTDHSDSEKSIRKARGEEYGSRIL